jgi:hypothetical protein
MIGMNVVVDNVPLVFSHFFDELLCCNPVSNFISVLSSQIYRLLIEYEILVDRVDPIVFQYEPGHDHEQEPRTQIQILVHYN